MLYRSPFPYFHKWWNPRTKNTKFESGTSMPSYHRCQSSSLSHTRLTFSPRDLLSYDLLPLGLSPLYFFFFLCLLILRTHLLSPHSTSLKCLPNPSDPFPSVLLHHPHHPRLLLRVELAHDRPHAALRQCPGLVDEVVLEAEVGREDLLHQGVVHAAQRAQARHLSDGRDAALSRRLRGQGVVRDLLIYMWVGLAGEKSVGCWLSLCEDLF